ARPSSGGCSGSSPLQKCCSASSTRRRQSAPLVQRAELPLPRRSSSALASPADLRRAFRAKLASPPHSRHLRLDFVRQRQRTDARAHLAANRKATAASSALPSRPPRA